MNVVVLGGGSWGTAFSVLLRDRGNDVTLACRDREQARAIAASASAPHAVSDCGLIEVARRSQRRLLAGSPASASAMP